MPAKCGYEKRGCSLTAMPSNGAGEEKSSRSSTWSAWFRDNHDLVNAAATAIGTVIAAVGVIIATSAFVSQREQNRLVQEQLASQEKQNRDQRDQFLRGRQTELAKIVFDSEMHSTMRGFAVRELISLELRSFGKNGHDEDNAERRWDEASKERDERLRKQGLRKAAQWRCEEFYDTGGGSGHTERRMLDLRNADLSKVDLSNTQILCVDFSGADLSGADLTDVYFSNVILDGVKLEGAVLNSMSVHWALLDPNDSPNTATEVARIFEESYSRHLAVPCLARRGYRDPTKAQLRNDCNLASQPSSR